MYNPAVARWNGVDASSENYRPQSPYHYAGNNPIIFVDFDGNDYGVIVNREKKTITIKAHYLTSSATKGAFARRGLQAWNSQSGRNTFVVGSVREMKKALKAGKTAEAYKVNVELTASVLDGEPRDPNTSVRDEVVRQDESGTINSVDVVEDFYEISGGYAGGTGNNEIDMDDGSINSGKTTHEVSHSLGIAHIEDGGTIENDGGESVNPAQVAESLMGVGIGGDNISRNQEGSIGDGTLLNGSTNQGLGQGTLISTRRYDRIVRRMERRSERQQ